MTAITRLVDCLRTSNCPGTKKQNKSNRRFAGLEPLESRQLLSVGLDAQGWTVVTPSTDTRVIYVSQSAGNDANSGLSANSPVKTLAKGASLLRSGSPDWLLLKEGDVWTNESLSNWRKSGRSDAEPMVIGSYGTGARPLIRSGTASGMSLYSNVAVSHLVVQGLSFQAHTYTGTGGATGIRWVGSGSDVTFEDIKVDGYKDNILVQEYNGSFRDIALRRSVVVNAYSKDSHAQGMYISGVDGVLLEGNVFDHNGWKEGVTPATIFNHNVYVQVDNTGLVARGNIFSRASSHGLQARPGGIIEDNLFIDNPLNLSFGLVNGDRASDAVRTAGVSGRIANNVIIGSGNINGEARGTGIEIANINSNGLSVINNVIAHDTSAYYNSVGISLSGSNGPQGLKNLNISSNVMYDWNQNLAVSGVANAYNVNVRGNQFQEANWDGSSSRAALTTQESSSSQLKYSDNFYDVETGVAASRWFMSSGAQRDFTWWKGNVEGTAVASQLAYVDPRRTLASYNASLGGTASLASFLDAAKRQERDAYDIRYTAGSANRYIADGFKLASSTPSPTVFSTVAFAGDAANWTPKTASRWSVLDDGGGKRYALNTSNYQSPDSQKLGEYSILKNSTSSDFDLSLRVRINESLSANPLADYAVVFGYVDDANYLYLSMNAQAGSTQLWKISGGTRTLIASATAAGIPNEQYNRVSLKRTGQSLTVSLNGTTILTASDPRIIATGSVGVGSFNDSVYFDDVDLRQSAVTLASADTLRAFVTGG